MLAKMITFNQFSSFFYINYRDNEEKIHLKNT